MEGIDSEQPIDKIQEGVKKGYIRLLNDNTRIEYLPQGHKELFNDPEEHVRAGYYFDLIEKYRYSGRRISGRVSDLHFMLSHQQPKLITIHKQSDDDIMHLD